MFIIRIIIAAILLLSPFIQLAYSGSNIVSGIPNCNSNDSSCVYLSGAITYGIKSKVHGNQVICSGGTDVYLNGLGTCQFPYPSQTTIKCTNGLKSVIYAEFKEELSSYSISGTDQPNQIYWLSQFYQEAQSIQTNVSGDGLVVQC